MAVLSNTGIRAGASAAGDSGYKVEKSLRFNPDDSPELTMTPSGGNSKKYTISFWAKICDSAGSTMMILQTDMTDDDMFRLYFSAGKYRVHQYNGSSYDWQYISTPIFKDPAAWYHIVFSYDSDNTTEADRARTWINGVQLTDWDTVDHPSSSEDSGWNKASNIERIGREYTNTYGEAYKYNGYLAEMYNIDGQALAASDFGETDEDTGKWVPKKYSGTYGPKVDQSQTWSDSVTNPSGAYGVAANAFDGDITTHASPNYSNPMTYTNASPSDTVIQTFEVKCDIYTMSGITVELNDTDITSQLTTTDQWHTITGFTDEQFEKFYWRPSSEDYEVRIKAIRINGKVLVDDDVTVNDNSFYLKFNGTDLGEDSSGNDNDFTVTNLETRTGDPLYGYVPPGSGTEPYWIDIKPASSDLSYGTEHLQGVLNGSESSGYIYNTGLLATGSGGTCFEQILFDLRDEGTITSLRTHYYCYGTSYDPMHQVLLDADKQEISGSEDDLTGSAAAGGSEWFDFNGYNFSTGTQPRYIKIYYKDGDYTSNGRQQLNIIEVNGTKLNNTKYANTDQNSTPNAEGDESTDTPIDFDDSGNGTGNYATLNPLDVDGSTGTFTMKQGNLVVDTFATNYSNIASTIGFNVYDSNGFYFESTGTDSGTYGGAGITESSTLIGQTGCAGRDGTAKQALFRADAHWYYNGTAVSGITHTWSSTDCIGVAVKDGKIWVSKNGTWLESGNPSTGANPGITWVDSNHNTNIVHFFVMAYAGGPAITANFGQRAFKYTPPTGFKALNTYNLADPTITDPNKYFDASVYTGAGSSVDVSTNFSPDLVWVKSRLADASHNLIDKVRGDDNYLMTNSTDGEDDSYADVLELKSDGYTVGSNNSAFSGTNGNIGWAWDAGEANTSVSAGGLDATLFDKSQTWSTAGSTTGSTYSGYPWSGVFNENAPHAPFKYTGTGTGNAVHNASSSSTTKYTFAGSGLTGVTSIKLSTVDYNDGELILNEGESDEVVFTGTTYNKQTLYEDTTITTLKSVSVKGISGIGHALFGIIVNGKALIDSGNSHTVPTLAGTYRANPSVGFSIVEWTGTTSNETLVHGLNAKPDFMICKKTGTGGNSWVVWHKDIGDTKYLILNGSGAAATDSTLFNSHTNDDSNVFSLGTNNSFSDSSQTAIAYLWSGVEGYSKFGSYEGNGSTDGTFVYLGFKPAFFIIKDMDGGGYWFLGDTAREPYNNGNFYGLWANTNDDEFSYEIDVVSNGIKHRSTSANLNTDGNTFIYAAWAESPFKYTNAR